MLIAARRWRALASAALTVVALAALSLLAFGAATWEAFIGALPVAADWNARGTPGFDHFVSPYAAVRLLGGNETAAWAVQSTGAAIAAVCLVIVARKRMDGWSHVAALIVATGFCVPFLGDYDLIAFTVAGAWIASEALRENWLPYERIGLAMLYVSPIAIKAAAAGDRVPLGPVALLLLAVLVFRRAMVMPGGTGTVRTA